MASGIEVAGLALAILPLVVNQIDAYVLGIERIKLLRRYQTEFKGYSRRLKTQQVLLLDTLEQALEGVVHEEEKVSDLINDPLGSGWKDPELQRKLRYKLGRSHDIFLENMAELLELIEMISRKLQIDTSGEQVIPDDGWDFRKFRKIFSKAIYDDILQRLNSANAILRTLVDYSTHREESQTRRQPWAYLLKRYREVRRQADGLFHAVVEGNNWHCCCKDQHCVHLKLNTNPLRSPNADEKIPDAGSPFQLVFSTSVEANKSTPWSWTEVTMEPYSADITSSVAKMSLCDESMPHGRKGRRVQFEIPQKDTMNFEKHDRMFSSSLIQDMCSSLSSEDGADGYITDTSDSMRYLMHRVKVLSTHIPQKPLGEVLSGISGKSRLCIGAMLACCVVQFHGNWLKPNWTNSDIQLASQSDGYGILMDSIYLKWPVHTQYTTKGIGTPLKDPNASRSHLLSLGISLVELSLGKSLPELLGSGDSEDEKDLLVTKRATASYLVEQVWSKSGLEYADAVSACFSWSEPHHEQWFEDRIFQTIVSPLLKNLSFQESL